MMHLSKREFLYTKKDWVLLPIPSSMPSLSCILFTLPPSTVAEPTYPLPKVQIAPLPFPHLPPVPFQ